MGYRLGNDEIVDSMLSEGLTCAMAACHMGVTAENVAGSERIPRAQDEFPARASGALKRRSQPGASVKDRSSLVAQRKVNRRPSTLTNIAQRHNRLRRSRD